VGTKTDKKHIAVRPYDDSMWDSYSMYDRMPFVWDPDMNVEKLFRTVTGNIIKAYRCKTIDPIEVKHK